MKKTKTLEDLIDLFLEDFKKEETPKSEDDLINEIKDSEMRLINTIQDVVSLNIKIGEPEVIKTTIKDLDSIQEHFDKCRELLKIMNKIQANIESKVNEIKNGYNL